jgi:exonuclease III
VWWLNADNRQREVRSKIEESECDIICLQETKYESFDWRLLRKLCPKKIDSFAYAPSQGASGGILVVWNSSILKDFLCNQRNLD